MNFKELIESAELVRLRDKNLRKFTSIESSNVTKFTNTLLEENNCHIIFRGESLSQATNKAGVSSSHSLIKCIKHLSRNVFYMGSKSKSYLHNQIGNVNGLTNINTEIFELLFDNLQKTIDNDSYQFTNEFNRFFRNHSNKTRFIEEIEPLEEKEKLSIKWYYSWLLHITEQTNYNEYSHFLSTTTDYDAAKRFSNGGIIYVGWIPKPIIGRGLSFDNISNTINTLKTINMPVSTQIIYPEEREISLIGGFFPQYLFGIYSISTNKLIINHYLLDDRHITLMNENLSNDIIRYGIDIDQSDFVNNPIFRNSAYKRYLTRNSETMQYQDHALA